MLEPRRLAAKAIASRMAQLLGEEVGESVGYRIRFETRVSSNTIIEVLTEGILTRILQSDNELKDVAMVIFDEFHERSIHADLALALCRESQQVLRSDLKLLVMSATLDMPQLTKLLSCPSAVSKGKLFPVEVHYEGDTDEWSIPEQCAGIVAKALKNTEGDILVFLPGQGEILRTQEILKKQSPGVLITPLYGALPINKQHRAILPDKEGKRKIVLSTSIAETSLTIEGIKVVVDSGFGRTSRFDNRSGLSRLQTIRISKDNADQRKGRAGRLSPGVCYRMWSKATHSKLDEHIVPEIMETDLASLVLDMAKWGVTDIGQLTWLTPPPKGSVLKATKTLTDLEALENGKITAYGERMLNLPCHPRIAHMLLKAEEMGLVALASDIAAILEERDPLGKEAGIDINLRIEGLRKFRSENRSGGRMARIRKVADSYLNLFEISHDNGYVDPYETGVLLTFAYPERIAHARPGNNAQFKLANGKIASASHKDDLAHEPWLAVAHMDAREDMGKIFLGSPLDPKDLAPMVKEQEVIKWDTEDGGLTATRELRIGSIVLKSTPLAQPDETHLLDAILEAIKKDGLQLLDFNEKVVQWQNRIQSLRKWRPEDKWPDMSSSILLMTCRDWLSPYLNGITKPHQLKKLNLIEILAYHLEPSKRMAMDQLAPERITVPSGAKVQLNYRENGMPPVLAVRIQEVFGLKNTPTINEGKIPVLMQLLSPGFKPVQITSDLQSFWKETYFEVKKDLKRRYPKHSWPDDPINESPIRGVKRKN